MVSPKNGRLDRVVGPIYEAASDSRRWTQALEGLQQCLEASAVAWAEYDFSNRTGSIRHYVGYDPAYVRLYNQTYAATNAWLRPGEWYTSGQISFGEAIVPPEELTETEFYAKWLKPQGFFHRLCAVVKRDDEHIVYLEAMRSQAQGGYVDEQRRLLHDLFPHLQKATQRGHHFWRLAVSLDIIDTLPFAVAAVNKTGHVFFANRLAEEALRDQKGLCLGPKGLRASAINVDRQLKDLIARAVATSAGKGQESGGALVIRRGGNLTPIWVVVAPLNRRLRKVIDQEDEIALVFVSTPERLGKIQETTLRTFYGLTAAEQRVAMLILEGRRLEEAAQQLQISRNTVRTHMKHIYAKTKTERQADLVRVLLTGPVGPLNFPSLLAAGV